MKKIWLGCGAVVAVVVGGLAIAGLVINPDSYRGRLVQILAQKTGRTVRLDGPIHVGISLDGLVFSIENAALGNPAWASRSNMAGIGTFKLGVNPFPLLHHKLVVTTLTVTNADIQLETSTDGQNNWEFTAMVSPAAVQSSPVETSAPSTAQPVSMDIDHVTITDSQIAMRGKDGKISAFKVSHLAIMHTAHGMDVDFQGAFNSAPIALKMQTGTDDVMASRTWPLALDLVYASYHLQAKGTANLASKNANFESYRLTSGASDLGGTLAARWDGARPSVTATMTSSHLDPHDFTPPPSSGGASTAGAHPIESSPYVLSDQPLGLDGLKAVDADIQLALHDVVLPSATLNQIEGRINIAAGHLDMPTKISFGKSILSADIKMNATASPAQLGIMVASPGVDLADLLDLVGIPAFLSGAADANANLGASGNSLHALASTLTGTMEITGKTGTISSSATQDISSSLTALFSPDGSNSLDCFAARFIANQGVVHDNGILIDTAATTIAGKGGLDMRNETLSMILRAETKMVSTGGFLPPLHIKGTFAKPSFAVDPKAVLSNVVGLFSGGTLDSGVPALQSPAGQNACIYTLDHPVTATAGQADVSAPGLQGAANKVQNISKQLMKGLFGQ